ncbi:hypothetical protein [Microbulbifer discodermiae]|uniref:hypothetical protein n=1 Tax=Microbulbifer sp. 2201CG32-9 TaxID=3232309 RepID=UPI00345BD2C8
MSATVIASAAKFLLGGLFDTLGPVNTNFDKICVYGNHKIAIQNYRTPAAFTAR